MTAACSTTKKNFFISYLCYKLFRNKNLLIISALFSALCIPLFSICMSICIGMVNSAVANSEFDPQKIYDMQNNIDTISLVGFSVALVSALIVVVLTFVIVNSTFSYNLKKCDSDMYLSLPLTTSQRFFGDLLTGTVISILPMAICGAVSSAIVSASGIGIDAGFTTTYLNAVGSGNMDNEINIAIQGLFSKTNNIIYRELPELVTYIFLALTVTLIFMYLFCVLINSFTGKTTDYIVYTIIAVAAVSAIVVSICGMALNRVTDSMSNEEFSSVFMFASPAGMAFAFLSSFLSSFKDGIYTIEETDGVYSALQTDRYNMYSVFNTRNIIIMIIVFAVCLGLAYLATRLRKAEKTGSHFVFELPYHIISLSVIFAVFSFAAIDDVVLVGDNARMTVIVCVIISAVVYFFIELTHGRKFKKIWQSLLRYVGTILCTLLVCNAVKSVDIFGLEHYVPVADNVKSVGISTSKLYSDCGNLYDYTVNFSDKEIIKAITDYHSFITDNEYAYCNNNYAASRSPKGNHASDNSSIKLSYELYDGRIVTRRFGIEVDEQNYGDYAKALYDMRCAISKTDEYVRTVTSKEPLQIKFFTKTGDIYGRMLNEDMNNKVLSAIGNDYKAGRNTGKLVAIAALMYSPSDESYYDGINIEIRENCTETLALLNNEANSVSLKQSTIETAKEELKNYMESDEYSEEDGYKNYLSYLYSVTDLTKSEAANVGYVNSYVYIAGIGHKTTNVTCDYADSQSVSELEKQFIMYDYYTDGLLADMDYVILCETGHDNSFGGAYFAPRDNSKRVADLIYSIRKEFNIPIEQ